MLIPALRMSIGVVAYNEEKCLPQLLKELLAQDYPHELMEIILVDGISSDATKRIMQDFAAQHGDEFIAVKVLENVKRKQAPGWNLVISQFSTDALIRVDAHASIPADFVSNNVAVLGEGYMVCGGKRPNIIPEPSPVKDLLLLVESSLFGSSIAAFRRSDVACDADTFFHGCYRREVLETVGGFNEGLGRTEDNEFHYRIRQAGYKLRYDPRILSFQHARPSLKTMLKQKWGNGYWVGLTLGVCPGCLSLYHFVPLAFVLAIILSTVLACCGICWPAIALWAAYALFTVISTVAGALQAPRKHFIYVLAPLFFLLLHLAYGLGTLKGLILMPFKRSELKEGRA